jgi:hypothetical protein
MAFLVLSPNIVKPVAADSENYKTPISMPKEYINYTIIPDQNGTLWAIVDGYYPMYLHITANKPKSFSDVRIQARR